MDQDRNQPIMNKILTYMKEVKTRVKVVQNCLDGVNSGVPLTGYFESDFELCMLQLRKCCEIIMFSSLASHYHAGLDLQKKLYEAEWNASKILRYIETKNSHAFPRSFYYKGIDNDGTHRIEPRTDAMTRTEFCELYDRTCGKYLHASRDPNALSQHSELFESLAYWLEKFIAMTDFHCVFVNAEVIVGVQMNGEIDIDPTVFLIRSTGPYLLPN